MWVGCTLKYVSRVLFRCFLRCDRMYVQGFPERYLFLHVPATSLGTVLHRTRPTRENDFLGVPGTVVGNPANPLPLGVWRPVHGIGSEYLCALFDPAEKNRRFSLGDKCVLEVRVFDGALSPTEPSHRL